MPSERAASATPAEGASQGHLTGYGTPGYRSYVLNSLLLVYVLNFVDRGLLSVVAGKLKAEIGISDFGWGLLTGFGFALLYTIVGIPLARVSEQRNRIWIMAICLVAWSGFTALCGMSHEADFGNLVLTSFGMLLIFRVGVGIGEAGCTPPANSLISDYYPADKRSTALGWYAMGVTIGTASANIIGGPITDAFGWRNAFYILGLPGIAVALILLMTVKEPPRGYSDLPGAPRLQRATWVETISALFSKPSFWWMMAATTIASFCGYAIAVFQSLYLQRTFHVTVGDAAFWITGPAYAAGAAGTLLTGWLAQKIGKRSVSSIAWLAAIGLAISVPFYLLAFWVGNVVLCTVFLALGHFVKYGYLAAQYTITQGVVSLRMRATATAILLFAQNFLGYGLGPLFAGAVSDAVFNAEIAQSAYVQTVSTAEPQKQVLTRQMCDRALQAVATNGKAAVKQPMPDLLAGLTPGMDEASYKFCDAKNQSATQAAMLIISAIYALGGLCFLICMFMLKRDFEAAAAHRFGTGEAIAPAGIGLAVLGAAGVWASLTYLQPGASGDVILRWSAGGQFHLGHLIYGGGVIVSGLIVVLGFVLVSLGLRRKAGT